MLDKYVNHFTPEYKARNYKKNKLTWHKKRDGLTIVFSIQKSQYGADVWYYNFGVIIDALSTRQSTAISACDVIFRVDQKNNGIMIKPEQILQIADLWEERFGDLKSLRIQALEGKMRGFWIAPGVLRYLTQVDISKL